MKKIKFYLAGVFCLGIMLFFGQNALANSTITGTALKGNGLPFDNLNLYLFNESNIYYDTTNDDGEFTITVNTAPISGDYTLRLISNYASVQDAGFILTHLEYVYPQTRTISIVDGVDQNDVNLTFNIHGILSGQVTDTNENELSDAYVYVWNKNGQSITGSASSNVFGNYYATPVYSNNLNTNTAGNYQAYITLSGYLPKYISNFTIADNQTTAQNITLVRKSFVAGNIKTKFGANLTNVIIKVYRLGDSTAYAITQTDSNGNYSIELGRTGSFTSFGDFTAKGKYILEIAGDDTAAYNKKTKKISVTADESNLTKNFTLSKKKGTFSGKVKTKKGKKIEGAMVKVNLLTDPMITSTTYSDSTGRYSFAHLTSGNYQVTVSKDGYVNYEIANKKIKKGTKKTFKLATAGDISGYVFDAVTRKPIYGIAVFMYNSDLSTTTNTQGYYVIKNVPTGNRKIFAKNQYYLEQFYYRETSLGKAKNIKVKKNKENKNNNFYLTSYTRVNR